jgi:hypothetical protein
MASVRDDGALKEQKGGVRQDNQLRPNQPSYSDPISPTVVTVLRAEAGGRSPSGRLSACLRFCAGLETYGFGGPRSGGSASQLPTPLISGGRARDDDSTPFVRPVSFCVRGS